MWLLCERMFTLLMLCKGSKVCVHTHTQSPNFGINHIHRKEEEGKEVKYTATISGVTNGSRLLFTFTLLDFLNTLQCLQSTHS